MILSENRHPSPIGVEDKLFGIMLRRNDNGAERLRAASKVETFVRITDADRG
jgi:hypothetical protein